MKNACTNTHLSTNAFFFTTVVTFPSVLHMGMSSSNFGAPHFTSAASVTLISCCVLLNKLHSHARVVCLPAGTCHGTTTSWQWPSSPRSDPRTPTARCLRLLQAMNWTFSFHIISLRYGIFALCLAPGSTSVLPTG